MYNGRIDSHTIQYIVPYIYIYITIDDTYVLNFYTKVI